MNVVIIDVNVEWQFDSFSCLCILLIKMNKRYPTKLKGILLETFFYISFLFCFVPRNDSTISYREWISQIFANKNERNFEMQKKKVNGKLISIFRTMHVFYHLSFHQTNETIKRLIQLFIFLFVCWCLIDVSPSSSSFYHPVLFDFMYISVFILLFKIICVICVVVFLLLHLHLNSYSIENLSTADWMPIANSLGNEI